MSARLYDRFNATRAKVNDQPTVHKQIRTKKVGQVQGKPAGKVPTNINDILANYKCRKNVELELRLQSVSEEQFEKFYNSVLSSGYKFHKIEQSVNAISQFSISNAERAQEPNHIRKMVKNGEKFSNEYILKTRVVPPVYVSDYINYTINLNEEKKLSDAFPTSPSAMIRLKIRSSFIDPTETWRIDFTAVKSAMMKDIAPVLNTITKKLFVPMTAENFLMKLDFDHINKFEIEIEHIGDKNTITPDDLTIVNKLFAMLDSEHETQYARQNEIYNIASLIVTNTKILNLFKSTYGLKNMLNQAVSLDKSSYYDIFPPSGYYVTEKADGERAVIYASDTNCSLIYTSMDRFNYVGGLGKYVAEGELVTVDGKKMLLLFDVMVFNGESLLEQPLSKRIEYLSLSVEYLSKFTKDSDVTIASKTFLRLETPALRETFEKVYRGKYPYAIDGLMIVTPDKGYHQTISMKFKGEHSTIDFLLIRIPDKHLGKTPFVKRDGHDLYVLFVGISYAMQKKLGLNVLPWYNDMFPNRNTFGRNISVHDNYNPIQFSPSANPHDYLYYHPRDSTDSFSDLHYKIVELRKIPAGNELGEWKFVRVRDDRKPNETYYGNDYKTAELIYMDYIDPLKFEQLYKPETGYFTKKADNIYKPGNNFRRFVISILIDKYFRATDILLDLGGGRGAEVKKYIDKKVKSVFFIDVDPQALAELNKRRLNMTMQKKLSYIYTGEQGGIRGTAINIIHADLKTNYKLLLEKIDYYGVRKGMATGVMSNFVFHYFCDTPKNLDNVIMFAACTMNIGAYICITVLNGKRVFDKLREFQKDDSWKLSDGEKVVYEIKKMYSDDELALTGQKIAVRVPFSDDLYEEPLCNTDYLISRFTRKHFTLVASEGFGDYLAEYKKKNITGYSAMSDIDIEYSKLFQLIVFCRTK